MVYFCQKINRNHSLSLSIDIVEKPQKFIPEHKRVVLCYPEKEVVIFYFKPRKYVSDGDLLGLRPK